MTEGAAWAKQLWNNSPPESRELRFLQLPEGQCIVHSVAGKLTLCKLYRVYSRQGIETHNYSSAIVHRTFAHLIPLRPATDPEIAAWTALCLQRGTLVIGVDSLRRTITSNPTDLYLEINLK